MSAYISHLSQVNEIQPVFAKADIMSFHGSCVAARGTRIDSRVAAELGQVTLAKPIEHYLLLDEGFNADIIYQLFHEFITSDPYFEDLYTQCNIDNAVIHGIEAFSRFEVLRQRLNVLAIQMPDVFDQSLFCAWIGITILTKQKASRVQLDNFFIAALSHDFGLLDISPEVLFKESALSSQEWQLLQQHPKLSYNILNQCQGISADSARAVAEHHESVDGTGYYSGKFENQLGEWGQLIHFLDSAHAIYRKHFKPRRRSLSDLLPILQMTTLAQGGHIVESLRSLFNRAPKTSHTVLTQSLATDSIELLKANALEISEFIRITGLFTQDIGTKHRDIKVLTVQNIARLIKNTLADCGIINEAYMRWLDQVEREQLDFAYREIEDVLLMTTEIKFHISRCERQIAIYITQNSHSNLHNKILKLQGDINAIEKHQASQELQLFLAGKNVA